MKSTRVERLYSRDEIGARQLYRDLANMVARERRGFEEERARLESEIAEAKRDVRLLGELAEEADAEIARLREALNAARPFVNLALTHEQAEASPCWHGKAVTALSAIAAALRTRNP